MRAKIQGNLIVITDECSNIIVYDLGLTLAHCHYNTLTLTTLPSNSNQSGYEQVYKEGLSLTRQDGLLCLLYAYIIYIYIYIYIYKFEI